VASIQWAVFIVVNHTRRELLAESAAVRAERLDSPGWWDERLVISTARAKHWEFNEDRMKVVGVVPVDDEEEARVLAARLGRDLIQLGFHCPRIWQLVSDGYRVLRSEEGLGRTAVC
jgi:hypothetical protein